MYKLSTPSYINYSSKDIFYTNDFGNLGIDDSFVNEEVFIPRVRFKPGYQRLWRLARASLKESLGLKYTYQYRLTRYLSRFSRQAHNYFLNFSENSLKSTLLYSKLLPNNSVFSIFLKNKLIYLNGILVFNDKRLVFINDFVQIIVSK